MSTFKVSVLRQAPNTQIKRIITFFQILSSALEAVKDSKFQNLYRQFMKKFQSNTLTKTHTAKEAAQSKSALDMARNTISVSLKRSWRVPVQHQIGTTTILKIQLRTRVINCQSGIMVFRILMRHTKEFATLVWNIHFT
jgi:hypothetical protein